MENIDGQETEVEVGTLSEPEIEEVKTEEPTEPAEPGQTEEAEKSEESGVKEDVQAKINKRIDKIHREKKEAEEAAAAERVKREALEAKLKELQKVEIPEIPPVPDYLDSEYEAKLAERDKIIGLHAQEESRNQALEQIEIAKANDEAAQNAKMFEGLVKSFDERTEVLKLDKSTLADSQNVVGSYIKGKQELAKYLLADENGPLNVLYLSENRAELEKISRMTDTNAAVYIATKIAPEAEKLKPKITNAPEPPYDPQGNKNVKEEHPYLTGATFE